MSKRIVLMTGDGFRHQYLIKTIRECGELAGLVYENRPNRIPEPQEDLDEDVKRLWRHHFNQRDLVERAYFDSKLSIEEQPTRHITKEDLNSEETKEFLRKINPRLVISYGCHKITDDVLFNTPGKKWNVHGGLSPWYRGAITLFWPSYMLQPQFSGMTLHETTNKIDGGDIVHQSKAKLRKGLTYHALTCEAVKSLVDEMPEILRLERERKLKPFVKQTTSGRIWRGRDWRPEHLRLIYDVHKDNIVGDYLDGKFKQEEPKLVRQDVRR